MVCSRTIRREVVSISADLVTYIYMWFRMEPPTLRATQPYSSSPTASSFQIGMVMSVKPGDDP